MLNPFFFTKQSSQCILYGFREGSPLHAFIISKERHTASTKAYSVEMASAQCNNSILSLKKTPFGWRTNEDKLTTKQLGLPRPNVSIRQVSTKGGKSYIQELERKTIAVVKWRTLSLFLYTTVTFYRFHSVFHSSLLALTLNIFYVMTYFAFVSQYFQDQSINIVGFDLYVAPFFMLLLDISCVLLSYVTSYNISDTWIMKKWDNLMWRHIMFAYV